MCVCSCARAPSFYTHSAPYRLASVWYGCRLLDNTGVCEFLVFFSVCVGLTAPHLCLAGDVTLEQIYDVARTMRPRSMAKTFQGTVKVIAT